MTTVNKRTRANSQEKTRNAVLATLKLSDQPLVLNEVQALLAMRGVSLHVTYVSEILKQLVRAGEISQRNETPAERVIRFGRHEPRGAHFKAVYFWGQPGKVPARTKVSNVHMTSRMTKKTRRPAKAARVQTGTKITARENLSLMARVSELEAQIAEMRKIIG
jgi:hypothetical protein